MNSFPHFIRAATSCNAPKKIYFSHATDRKKTPSNFLPGERQKENMSFFRNY